MIFFVPRYDAATEANFSVALSLLSEGAHALLVEAATRAQLIAALTAWEEPLFAMTHGRQDRLLAQDGEYGLGRDDHALLKGREVFAYACHSAGELGQVVSSIGGVWWGYTGSIAAPEATPSCLPLFAAIFSYIRDAFPAACLSRERMDVIGRIADLCHEAELRVDQLGEADPDLDIGSALFSLLHLWQRLRVWEPGASTPLKHPAAPPPLLL
ncbi:MAG TPA: hypothetical protein VEW48_16205 [Thermoanaerobaculia bacterium]|nr:hypothetical protein [Thermoanaerobaculia bacterium]